MSFPTDIGYCHGTWSPWFGCTHFGPGCDHCFAEKWAKRTGMVGWGPGAPRRKASPAYWKRPLLWNKQAQKEDKRYRILTDLCDPFDAHLSIPGQWREEYMELMVDTPYLDWMVLTKRASFIPMWNYPENMWLGITVCNQAEADRDIPIFLNIPASRHWISYEPALGPVDLGLDEYQPIERIGKNNLLRQINWVVMGAESGPGRRPMLDDWARSVRDQCVVAGVPFFLKQMEINGMIAHDVILDGQKWEQIPA